MSNQIKVLSKLYNKQKEINNKTVHQSNGSLSQFPDEKLDKMDKDQLIDVLKNQLIEAENHKISFSARR